MDVTTVLSTAGQKSRQPAAEDHLGGWWGDSTLESSYRENGQWEEKHSPCQGKCGQIGPPWGPTKARRGTHGGESEFLTHDRLRESRVVLGPPTHEVGTFLSYSLAYLSFHWLTGNYCQRPRKRWAEKEKRNQLSSPLSQSDTLPIHALGGQESSLPSNKH